MANKSSENLTKVKYKLSPGQVKYVKHNTEARSRNQRYRGKAIIITYSECVFVASGIQYAMRMRRNLLSSYVLSGSTKRFSTLSHKREQFWGKSAFWFSVQNSSETFLVPTIIQPQARSYFNLLTPNDNYSGRTAPLTSKRYILYIYSTNIGTEYFKHGIYCPIFLFKMQFVS